MGAAGKWDAFYPYSGNKPSRSGKLADLSTAYGVERGELGAGGNRTPSLPSRR